MTGSTAYFTILATNYLPKALALAESLDRHQPGSRLTVVLIDARTSDECPPLAADIDNVDLVGTDFLEYDDAWLDDITMRFDLVEFATAIKPWIIKKLLRTSERAYYLDPDTYLTAPLAEMDDELAASEGGVLLTPHWLVPPGPADGVSEGHLLMVGIFNLGYCGFDRRGQACLDWWWGHLETECIFDYQSGLFVDQKWMDMGSVYFRARALRHPGYNVSVVNLHERPIGRDDEGFTIIGTGERLRLFHFHAFDTARPEELSTRFDSSTAHLREQSEALDALCREYAEVVIRKQSQLPAAPAYRYNTDSSGKPISRQLRRAYRAQSQLGTLPSAFAPEDAEAFAQWRRGAWRPLGKELVSDAMKQARLSFPEEYAKLKKKAPGLIGKVRSKTVNETGLWG